MMWAGEIKDYIDIANDYDGLKIHWVGNGEAKNVIYLLVEWEDKFTRQMIGDLNFYYQGKKYEFFSWLNVFKGLEVSPNKAIIMCAEIENQPFEIKYELKHCPVHNKWSLLCTK